MLKDLTRADLPRLVVLSQREIPRDTPVEILGSVVEEEPEVVTSFSTSPEVDRMRSASLTERARIVRSRTSASKVEKPI